MNFKYTYFNILNGDFKNIPVQGYCLTPTSGTASRVRETNIYLMVDFDLGRKGDKS